NRAMGLDVAKKYRDRQDLVALARPQSGVNDLKDRFRDTTPVPEWWTSPTPADRHDDRPPSRVGLTGTRPHLGRVVAHEGGDVERQLRGGAPTTVAGVAGARQPRRGVPAGDQVRRGGVPHRSDR